MSRTRVFLTAKIPVAIQYTQMSFKKLLFYNKFSSRHHVTTVLPFVPCGFMPGFLLSKPTDGPRSFPKQRSSLFCHSPRWLCYPTRSKSRIQDPTYFVREQPPLHSKSLRCSRAPAHKPLAYSPPWFTAK